MFNWPCLRKRFIIMAHCPKEHGFLLNKSKFCAAICLRIRWSLSNLPQQCNCGTVFSVDHAMTCHLGQYAITRFEISLLLWSPRSVAMFLWNLYFNLFLVTTSLTSQPILNQMLDWTFVHEVSSPQPSLQRIENMRPLRRECSTSSRGWTWCLHPTNFLYYWGDGPGSDHVLQKASRQDRQQAWNPLPKSDGIASLPPFLCNFKIYNSLHLRELFQLPSADPWAEHCPCNIRGPHPLYWSLNFLLLSCISHLHFIFALIITSHLLSFILLLCALIHIYIYLLRWKKTVYHITKQYRIQY